MNVTAMLEERASLIARARKLCDQAQAAGGSWLAEDFAEFNRLHDRAQELYGQVQAARRSSAAGPLDFASLDKPEWLTSGGLKIGEVCGRDVVIDPQSAAARRLTPEYAVAFADYLRSDPKVHRPVPAGTLQTDGAGDGGYVLAPAQFVVGLAEGRDDGDWFRRLANVKPPTTQEKVTQASRTAKPVVAWGSEIATTSPDSTMRTGSYSLTPHYMTGEFEVAIGVVQSPGGEAAVMNEVRIAGAELEEAAFVAGTGAGQPLGLFAPNDSGIGTARDVTGDPSTFEAWLDVKHSLRSVYLRSPSLRWVLHPLALRYVSKLKDSAGQPLLELAGGDSDQDWLAGVRVEVTDAAPSGASGAFSSGDYLGLLGDLLMYDVQDGLDLGILRLTDGYYARRGMVGYLFRRKVDGTPRVSEAFARLKKS